MATLRLSALISTIIRPVARDDDGQGLAEYALILVLVAIVAITALSFFGTNVSKMLSGIGSSV